MGWRRRHTLVDRLAPRCTDLAGDLTAQLTEDCDADTATRETERLLDFLALVDIAERWDWAGHG